MIGDSRLATRSRPTSLPAEARSVARVLRLLNSPRLATEVLLGGLSQVPSSPMLKSVQESIKDTVDSIHEQEGVMKAKEAEHRLSLAMEWAVQNAFSRKNTPPPPSSDDDGTGSIQSLPLQTTQYKSTTAAALVSDSSTAGGSDQEESTASQQLILPSETTLEQGIAMRKFWAMVLESLHLQVASRTTKVWGRKKIYEIYQLTGAALIDDAEMLRKTVETEFRTIYHGGGEHQSGCRTYALKRGAQYFVSINIGMWFDLQDERNRSLSGERKKKKANEFLAIITPGESLVALTASRAPSRSRFSKFVLAALDAALIRKGSRVQDASPQRVGDWSGTDPQELLQSAFVAQTGQAVGRFAKFAAEDIADPLVEMQKASTASMLDRSQEQARLARGAQHGREMAQTAAAVDKNMDAALVAANSNGVLIDPSAATKRSRKRARDQDLGNAGDCPRLERMSWKWTGETTAAAACWLEDGATQGELPATKFKCGLVLEGTNVMDGLREMVAAGWAKAPLPDFMRNAPTLGSSTVTVDHGAFAAADSFAAV